MSYANQASPYFLGCHLAFPGSTYKSDVIVVGFSAIPSQRSLKLTPYQWLLLKDKHAAAFMKKVISMLNVT